MYTQAKFLNFSVEEYLQFELQSRIRHEYIAGQVYPMREDSDNCRIIIANILTRLRTHLFNTNYRVDSSDMKVRIDDLGIFYYPSISVTSIFQDREKFYKTKPSLIIEVFSGATERIYRNEKLLNYQKLNSLQEYVLVSEAENKVEVHRKQNQNNWFIEELKIEDNLVLSSVVLEIAIAEIYEDVNL